MTSPKRTPLSFLMTNYLWLAFLNWRQDRRNRKAIREEVDLMMLEITRGTSGDPFWGKPLEMKPQPPLSLEDVKRVSEVYLKQGHRYEPPMP